MNIPISTAITLLTHQEGFQRVRANAETLYPDTFAGAWVTDQRSGGRLSIAFTQSAEANASQVVDDIEGVDISLVDAFEVERSLRDIRAIRDRGLDNLSELQGLGVFAFSVDEPTNSLEIWSDVSLSTEKEAVVEATLESTAVNIIVAKRPEASHRPSYKNNCQNGSRTHCNPLRGGTRLHVPNNYASYCTAGFNYRRDSDNLKLLSTAGHCSNTLEHSDVGLGYVMGSERGYADVQFHTRNGFSTSRWVFNRPNQQNYSVTGRYTGTALNEASRLCTSGVTSGPFTNSNRCGDVKDNDWSGVNSEDNLLNNQFIFNQTCAGGDSGSPVFSNSVGYGQVWGGDPRCFASYLRRIEDVHNVTLQN